MVCEHGHADVDRNLDKLGRDTFAPRTCHAAFRSPVCSVTPGRGEPLYLA